MGQANSKLRFEVEQIVQEVKDLQSYIKLNSHDFDDTSKDNLHKRLIEYSNTLQELCKTTKERHSKELKEAIKFVSKVTEELLQENVQLRHLDQGTVESSSFIHVPSKNGISASLESLSKKQQTKTKKDVINLDKYRLPSLEEIQNKTVSLKSEIESSIMNEDVNQMLIQQKIIQILATDLEMITYDPHSPLQETKVALEKDLSLLYRKLERSKNKIQKKNNEVAQVKQQREAKDSMTQLSDINNNVNQIFDQGKDLIKDENFAEINKLSDQLKDNVGKIEKVVSSSEEINKKKKEIKEKINKIISHIKSATDLYEQNKEREASDELKRAELLAVKYKENITQLDIYSDDSTYEIYKKNLRDLQIIVNEIDGKSTNFQARKTKCLENITELQELNEERFMKYHLQKNLKLSHKSIDSAYETQGSAGTKSSNTNESQKNEITDYDESVVLRKKTPYLAPKEIRTIDGFYSYWKEIENNLPSANCSFDELRQIVLLLIDLENQIRVKRTRIENFLKLKEAGMPLSFIKDMNYDQYTNTSLSNINKQIIDEVDSDAVKTNAKIYELNKPKVLVINDEEIIQNIDEINNQIKHVSKEIPEVVTLPPDSASESSEASKRNSLPEQNQANPTKGGPTPDAKLNYLEHAEVESVNIRKENKNSLRRESKENMSSKKLKTVKDLNNTNQIESITQIQNISRDVEYLKEKASNFTGSKQTPKYVELKNKLDSYRKTLNVLISYQNENITLSCNRVLQNIDEVMEILNAKTEKQNVEPMTNSATKENTIETLFTRIIDIKTITEDLNKKIEKYAGHKEDDEYFKLRDTLLKNKEILNNMKVSAKYENIAKSRSDVIYQIEECLYNLKFKVEENKIKYRNSIFNENEEIQNIMGDFQKIKDKVNRFSGSYQNVVYREIEKSTEKFLSNAMDVVRDEQFLNTLCEDAAKCLKILEQKSIKDSNYAVTKDKTAEFIERELGVSKDSVLTDNAIRLSRIRQNLKDISAELNSPSKLTLEVNKQLEHRINLNILELSSINIAANEPFYYDKETLRLEFLKLLEVAKENILAIEGESNVTNNQQRRESANEINNKSEDIENQLSKIEQSLVDAKKDIDAFTGEKTGTKFSDIDEFLTRLSITVENLPIKKGSEYHKKKRTLLKNIYHCSETLENKAQSYEILQNIEKRITEVTYRVNNFGSLSDGDYNALYRELVDLEVTLKDLIVSNDILDKKVACQINIRQCLKLVEGRISKEDDNDCGSDDGTLV